MQSFDRRLQILLSAAAKTFADRGFHATSVRDLARASGMSLAGIYHYVDSKVELLFLIQDRCFAQVIAEARQAVEAESDPRSRLVAFIHHHIVFFAGHMDEMKVLSHEYEELTGAMRTQVRHRKREYVELLLELLQAIDAPAVSHQVAAYALFGMMNWIYTWYHPRGAISPPTLADEIARLFLDGFANHPAPAVRLVVAHSGG